MPYKDPAKRAELTARWRKQTNTPEYMEWLYARRKLRYWIAESGRALLEEISIGRRGFQRRAAEWVAEVERRERELGTRFDHKRNEPYSP